jgi:hypothetical protein
LADNREEVALKKVPIFLRHRARKFIWNNRSDWDFYRDFDIKKGVPKRGFDVGTIQELQVHMGVYIHMYILMNMYMHVYIHTYMYTYTNIYLYDICECRRGHSMWGPSRN